MRKGVKITQFVKSCNKFIYLIEEKCLNLTIYNT